MLGLFRKSEGKKHSFETVWESELQLKDSSKGDFGLLNLVCNINILFILWNLY